MAIKMPKEEVVASEETTQEEITPVAESPKKTVPAKAAARKYDPEEMILTRSVTPGEMLLPGKKSGILYRWAAFGDLTEVEYQDLYALKASRSSYLYSPLFVIEDEELLQEARWKDLVPLYDSMYNSRDVGEILKLTPAQLRQVLPQIPTGFQKAVKIEVASRIEDGKFDSIQKIKVIDEIYGTDFISLI